MRSHLLALAAPAAAFLVPPELASALEADKAEGDFRILPAEVIDSPFALPPGVRSQSIDVPCLECPGKDASLRFDINVHNSDRLLVNGFEVYPANDPPVGDLTANVVTPSGESTEKNLDWIIWWRVGADEPEQGLSWVNFNLGVGGVGGVPVDNVALSMNLLVGPNGEIYIASAEGPGQGLLVDDDEPSCEGWWCPIQKMWAKLMRGGRGCHRNKGHKGPDGPGHGRKPHGPHGPHGHKKPHEHKPHGPHGPHGHHGHHEYHGQSLGTMIKNVAAHIFLPVVMGIAAGVGAAILAMFLCSLAAFVVRRLAGHETQYSWTLVPNGVLFIKEEIDDEKHGLMEGQAPPPAYDSPSEKQ